MSYFRLITSQRTVLVMAILWIPMIIKCVKDTKFWRKVSNRDKLSYFMNIAFGLSLLMVSIAFVTGNYIGEDNKVINVIEILISIGLIVLGIERLILYKKHNKEI